MIIKERGITGEVFSMYSGHYVEDLINNIAEKKCKAIMDWIETTNLEVNNTAIVGTYLTGIKLAERCSKFSEVTVVDINPHLHDLIPCEVEFSDDIRKIEGADLIVDTTGLGGMSSESVGKHVDSNIFLIEDPTSDGSDQIINKKNNIDQRLIASKSPNKGILRTTGLNSKTSGTMTLTIEVLRRSLEDILNTEGVLYGVAAMNFYEGILFKEKDCNKFLNLIKSPAMVISSIQALSPDLYIEKYLDKIETKVEDVSI